MRDRNTIIQQTVIYQEAPQESGTLSILLWLITIPLGLVVGAVVGLGWLILEALKLAVKALVALSRGVVALAPYLATLAFVGLLGAIFWVNLEEVSRTVKTITNLLVWGAMGAIAVGAVALLGLGLVVGWLRYKDQVAKLWRQWTARKQQTFSLSGVNNQQPIIIVVTNELEAERVRGMLETISVQRAGVVFETQPKPSTEIARAEYHR